MAVRQGVGRCSHVAAMFRRLMVIEYGQHSAPVDYRKACYCVFTRLIFSNVIFFLNNDMTTGLVNGFSFIRSFPCKLFS